MGRNVFGLDRAVVIDEDEARFVGPREGSVNAREGPPVEDSTPPLGSRHRRNERLLRAGGRRPWPVSCFEIELRKDRQKSGQIGERTRSGKGARFFQGRNSS